MLIVFEGPDKTGKSTSAANLSYNGQPIYNATKENYAEVRDDLANEPDLVQTFDRIDWLTHMIYRLSMPDHEWNDARVRTVFAMPEAHLVIKVHNPSTAGLIKDELYDQGRLTRVNEAYHNITGVISGLNQMWDFPLFKTVSFIEVNNDPESGEFSQNLKGFMAPGFEFGTAYEKLVNDDETLLEMLRYADQRIG